MKLSFTGTGSGLTTLKRHHSSLLIEKDSRRLLIDCGDGISRSLIKTGISYNSIDSIIISHFHPDHFSGLLTLLVNMYLTGRTARLQIFIHKVYKDFLRSLIYHSSLSSIEKKFEVVIYPFEFNEQIDLHGFRVVMRKNSHISNESDSKLSQDMNSSSILIQDSQANILYTSDIGDKNDLTLFTDYKIDILISEVTHINIEDIIIFSRKNNISRVFLTHIDEKLEDNISKRLKNDLSPSNFTISHDGLVVSV